MHTSFRTITDPAIEPLTVASCMQHLQVDSSVLELAPLPAAPLLVNEAGLLSNGVYRYKASIITSGGETEAGGSSAAITVADNAVAGKINVTGIMTGGQNVIARNIYRTAANGSDFLFVAEISNNTDTEFVDNVPDSSLGSSAPTANTTGDELVTSLIKSAREMVEAKLGRKLITQTCVARYDGLSDVMEFMPCQSLTSVQYYDINDQLQTLSEELYYVHLDETPPFIEIKSTATVPVLSDRKGSVLIEFVAGYGDEAQDVPKSIIQWMMFMVNTMWNTRHQFDLSTGRAALTEVSRSEYIDRALDSFTVYYGGR